MVEGWKRSTIGELFDISGGISASRNQLSDKGIAYLHYGDIHNSDRSFIDVNKDFPKIPKLPININNVAKQHILCNGDIAFVDASEDNNGIHRHVVIRNKYNIPFIAGSHTIVAKQKSNDINNSYVEFCFQSQETKQNFLFYAAGTKVKGVNKTSIKNIFIKFPQNHYEQQAIATALSDIDEYISSLEKLVSKKIDIK